MVIIIVEQENLFEIFMVCDTSHVYELTWE